MDMDFFLKFQFHPDFRCFPPFFHAAQNNPEQHIQSCRNEDDPDDYTNGPLLQQAVDNQLRRNHIDIRQNGLQYGYARYENE